MLRPQFTPQQRAFIVAEFYRNNNNVYRVIQKFREVYPNARCPSRGTVYNNVRKYAITGTSLNLNKGRSGRNRTARSAENIEAVRNAIEEARGEAPEIRISCRRNGLGLSSATFNRITRLDLHFNPYQMIRQHQLLPGDLPRQFRFCQWLLDKNGRFLDDLIIGDESGFSLNASVNTHNIREYCARGEHPLDFEYVRNDDRHKLTVWVGLMGNGTIIGPFFFRQSIDGEDYLNMIGEEIVPALRQLQRYRGRRNNQFRRIWWAQDGAPPHRRRFVTDRLAELFGDRVIALNHVVEWPPRSPNLTPLDFFLWGYLKSKVYQTSPANLEELEQRIRHEIDTLRQIEHSLDVLFLTCFGGCVIVRSVMEDMLRTNMLRNLLLNVCS